MSCVNQHHLLVNYVHDVKDILQVYELSTGQLVRDLPLDVGTVAGVSCKKKHSEFFYKFTSFTTPGNSSFYILEFFHEYEPHKIHFLFHAKKNIQILLQLLLQKLNKVTVCDQGTYLTD